MNKNTWKKEDPDPNPKESTSREQAIANFEDSLTPVRWTEWIEFCFKVTTVAFKVVWSNVEDH
jgi:hypothetical protein